MQVRQAMWLPVTLIVVGALLAGVRLWLILASGAVDPGALLAPLLVVIGVLGLRNPVMVYEAGEVQLRNLLGITMARYPLAGLTVATEGARRVLRGSRAGGRARRLMTAPPLLHRPADAAALIDAVAADLAARAASVHRLAPKPGGS